MRITRSAYLLCLGAAVFISGCSLLGIEEDLSEGLLFAAREEAYEPGDTVTLRLKNFSAPKIGVNLCYSKLQRKTETSWETIIPRDKRACLDYMITLEKGEDTTYEYELPTELGGGERLEAGTYRFTNEVHALDEDTEVEITSKAFTIAS